MDNSQISFLATDSILRAIFHDILKLQYIHCILMLQNVYFIPCGEDPLRWTLAANDAG